MGCDNSEVESEYQRQRRMTKRAAVMAGVAILSEIAAFAVLFWAADMQERGVSGRIHVPVALIGFFGFSILAIVLLMISAPQLIIAEHLKADRSYNRDGLTTLRNMSRGRVEERLLARKFQRSGDGYYHKKEYSFLIDFVSYDVRLIDDTAENSITESRETKTVEAVIGGIQTDDVENANDMESVILREMRRFDQSRNQGVYHNDKKKSCLLLLIYDEVGEYEKEIVKSFGKNRILAETVDRSWVAEDSSGNPQETLSVVVLAIDRNSGEGYFADIKGSPLTVYAHGCKMLKRLSQS